jgi:hypothetical protein
MLRQKRKADSSVTVTDASSSSSSSTWEKWLPEMDVSTGRRWAEQQSIDWSTRLEQTQVQRIIDLRDRIRMSLYRDKYQSSKLTKFMLPVALDRVIQSVLSQSSSSLSNDRRTDLTPWDAHECLERFYQSWTTLHIFETNGTTNDSADHMVFELSCREHLSIRKLLTRHHIRRSELEQVLGIVQQTLWLAKIQNGEGVGLIAGQSVGEKTTQMLMNTFHSAGDATPLTGGLPKLVEVVNTTKKLKTPSMKIVIRNEAIASSSSSSIVYPSAASYVSMLARKMVHTCLRNVSKEPIVSIRNVSSPMSNDDPWWWSLFHVLDNESSSSSSSRTFIRIRYPLSRDICVGLEQTPHQIMERIQKVAQVQLDSILQGIQPPHTSNRSDEQDITTTTTTQDANANSKKRKIVESSSSSSSHKRHKTSSATTTTTPLVRWIDIMSSDAWNVDEEWTIDMYVEALVPSAMSLCELAARHLAFRIYHLVVVSGYPGIHATTIGVDQVPSTNSEGVLTKQTQWSIRTDGIHFPLLAQMEEVDFSKSETNNVHDIVKYLGIDAAQSWITGEIKDVLKQNGAGDIDSRHIELMGDAMTYRGALTAFTRYGMARGDVSVMEKVAFEKPLEHIHEAAVQGTYDPCSGITEAVFVNKRAPIGTGTVELVADHHTTTTTSSTTNDTVSDDDLIGFSSTSTTTTNYDLDIYCRSKRVDPPLVPRPMVSAAREAVSVVCSYFPNATKSSSSLLIDNQTDAATIASRPAEEEEDMVYVRPQQRPILLWPGQRHFEPLECC